MGQNNLCRAQAKERRLWGKRRGIAVTKERPTHTHGQEPGSRSQSQEPGAELPCVCPPESVAGAKNPQSCHAGRVKLFHFPPIRHFPSISFYIFPFTNPTLALPCAQIAQVQENNYILRVPINLAEFLVSVLVLPTNSLAVSLPLGFSSPFFSNSIFLVEFAFYFS